MTITQVPNEYNRLFVIPILVSHILSGTVHSVVVYPLSTEDVVQIVKIATNFKMPIVPYSGGTSLEGHTRGHANGGICVDMSRMDRILEING